MLLKTAFLLLFITMVVILLAMHNAVLKRAGMNSQKRRPKVLKVALGITAWAVYVTALSYSGFLEEFSLPPRFPILLIFPLFGFTGFFLYKHRNSPLLKVLPKSWPIYFQSMRMPIELLFVGAVAQEVLPPQVTLEGYNYDFFIGLSALVVAYFVFTKKLLPEKLALYWNYIGLANLVLVIFLFTTTFFMPSIWGSATTLGTAEAVQVPYVFVAAFLMPLAVFVHFVSILQLRQK